MTMFLAVVDGSIYSHSVCDHAAWFARHANAEIEVIHILGRRELASNNSNLSGNIGLGARTALLEELVELDAQKAKLSHKRGRAILDDAMQRINEDGVSAVKTHLRTGEIVDTIQELETQTDMVVIGKRGEGADFDSSHLGSNLERVIRSIHKPVLVAAREFKPMQRFLIAFDGGPSAMLAIKFIAEKAHYADYECHLVMVKSPSVDTNRELEGAAAMLEAGGYKVTSSLVQGQPEKALAEYVDTAGIDLVVMGAYGHSRIRSLIIGSTTTEMIRACKVPVLLFR